MSVLNEVLLTETSHIQKYEENQERQSKIEDETKDHFTIENVEGIFIIRLEAGFDSKDMDNLNTAMQGIMFVRPLKIKFDFGGLNEFDDGYLNRIMVYAKKPWTVVETTSPWFKENRSKQLLSTKRRLICNDK